jgi:preprotein translocase subunit SecG
MFTAAIIIHIIVSLVIILAVLLQVGKGATIGSTFGGGAASQTVFGTSGGATFLSKVTTACAAIFMITSLFLTYTASKQRDVSIMGDLKEITAPTEPAAPVIPELPAMEGTPDPEAAVSSPAPESAAKTAE